MGIVRVAGLISICAFAVACTGAAPAAAPTAIVLSPTATPTATPTTIPSAGDGRRAALSELHHFDSFPASFPVMVATSDVVIMGTVSAVLEGRTVGDSAPVQIHRFQVDVDEVLAGSLESKTIIVVADEIFLTFLGDTKWAQLGERSVLFLEKTRDAGNGPARYRPVNSQGIYRMVGQDRLGSVLSNDEFAQRVAGWPLPELRRQLENAKEQIDRGEVQAEQPGPPGR